ncbi:hypothetical protein PSEUDO8Z_120134 [Pseudomonas sp. 8Z]|nr:hypothetical protein PSEUDO8Z_120134 [Pseudomonas sp. 8Z]
MTNEKKGNRSCPNCLACPVNWQDSALLALVRILPDEITNTPEEREHQKNGADSGENHCIDEHGCLLLCLSVWGGFTLSAAARRELIWINAR